MIRLLRRHSTFEDCVLTTLEDDVIAGIKRRHPDLCVGLSRGREKPERPLSTRMSELLPFRRRFQPRERTSSPSTSAWHGKECCARRRAGRSR